MEIYNDESTVFIYGYLNILLLLVRLLDYSDSVYLTGLESQMHGLVAEISAENAKTIKNI